MESQVGTEFIHGFMWIVAYLEGQGISKQVNNRDTSGIMTIVGAVRKLAIAP